MARGVRTARRPPPVAPIVPRHAGPHRRRRGHARAEARRAARARRRDRAARRSRSSTWPTSSTPVAPARAVPGRDAGRRPLAARCGGGAGRRRAPTSSSSWRPSSPARPRPTSRRATASTSTACGCCSRRSAPWASGYRPRLVFTSSIAVFGAPFPDRIGDEFHLTPLTSYGTQKAIGELLLCDYTRRGIVDGVGIRLPTICVRPGDAEQGRVRVLLEHHPRAAERPRGGAAGRRRRAAPAGIAALGRRQPRARRRHRRRRCSATAGA